MLTAESGRLEQLAREFTEFGRLPEGPAAPVDLVELLEELVRTSIPPTMTARLALDPATPVLQGHYDPLRRAFSNILRNAVEACGGEGELEIFARPGERRRAGRRSATTDPASRPSSRSASSTPTAPARKAGPGLGLALAKQTVELHQGTIGVERTPGGGATFVVRLRGL